MNQQTYQPKLNTKLTEDFDVNVFNKIYNDNKPILNLKELKPDKAKN